KLKQISSGPLAFAKAFSNGPSRGSWFLKTPRMNRRYNYWNEFSPVEKNTQEKSPQRMADLAPARREHPCKGRKAGGNQNEHGRPPNSITKRPTLRQSIAAVAHRPSDGRSTVGCSRSGFNGAAQSQYRAGASPCLAGPCR